MYVCMCSCIAYNHRIHIYSHSHHLEALKTRLYKWQHPNHAEQSCAYAYACSRKWHFCSILTHPQHCHRALLNIGVVAKVPWCGVTGVIIFMDAFAFSKRFIYYYHEYRVVFECSTRSLILGSESNHQVLEFCQPCLLQPTTRLPIHFTSTQRL